jgi:uncharacterized membrane protein HdeD (DUF308 family)
MQPRTNDDLPGMKSLKANWGWFLAIGIALATLGAVAIGAAMITGLAFVTLFGSLLFVGGVLQTVHAFWARRWSGFLVHLIAGLLYLVFGWMIMTRPGISAQAFAIVIAAFLLAGGLMRIILAVQTRGDNWFWMTLSGIINILLGLVIWEQSRDSAFSSLMLIGLFVGLEMIFNGASWIMVALAVRSLPDEPGDAASPPPHIG